jgi:hypothetical protein
MVAICLMYGSQLLLFDQTRGVALMVVVPLFAGGCALGYVAWRHDRWLRTRYERHLEGLCLECGYDLILSRQRCPECGAPVLPAQRYPALAAFFALHSSDAHAGWPVGEVMLKAGAWAVDRHRVVQELRRFLAEGYDEAATARILALDFGCRVRPDAEGLSATQWLMCLHARLAASLEPVAVVPARQDANGSSRQG